MNKVKLANSYIEKVEYLHQGECDFCHKSSKTCYTIDIEDYLHICMCPNCGEGLYEKIKEGYK